MEIIETNQFYFDEILSHPYHLFSTGLFSNLNEKKVDTLYYLLFKDSKFRLGIIIGVKKNIASSPFSAPFGGFIPVKIDTKIEIVENAVSLLESWLFKKGIENLNITLPPFFYNSNFISKQINVLFRNGFKIENIDLNYHLDVGKAEIKQYDSLSRSARKNLNISLKSGLTLSKCSTIIEKKAAFKIIQQNREERNYPLRMDWEIVCETNKIIDADFFICNKEYNIPVGAAMVFHVADNIAQVIYWGDLRAYSSIKPMNFISFKILEYYSEKGIQIIDIGPSTEDSIPNYGLCEFKEGIGCEISTKYSFKKRILI